MEKEVLEKIKKKYQSIDPKTRMEMRKKKGVILDAETAKKLPPELLKEISGGYYDGPVEPPPCCPRCGSQVHIVYYDDYYWELWCHNLVCDYDTNTIDYYFYGK